MRRYGLIKMVSGRKAKKDYHARPKRIWENWWESICDPLPRTTIKARVKKEIFEQLEK